MRDLSPVSRNAIAIDPGGFRGHSATSGDPPTTPRVCSGSCRAIVRKLRAPLRTPRGAANDSRRADDGFPGRRFDLPRHRRTLKSSAHSRSDAFYDHFALFHPSSDRLIRPQRTVRRSRSSALPPFRPSLPIPAAEFYGHFRPPNDFSKLALAETSQARRNWLRPSDLERADTTPTGQNAANMPG